MLYINLKIKKNFQRIKINYDNKIEIYFLEKNRKKKNNIKMTTKLRQKQNSFGTSNTKTKRVSSKTLRVGDIRECQITALAPNNVGIDEFSYPYAIFVPNAPYGSVIKAKVLKINKGTSSGKDLSGNGYAVAQMIEEVKSGLVNGTDPLKNVPVTAGEVLTVSITKETVSLGSKNATTGSSSATAGIVELTPNFRLIIPLWPGAPRENVKVSVTRVKAEYAFAKLESSSYKRDKGSNENLFAGLKNKNSSWSLSSLAGAASGKEPAKLVYGCKFTTILPKNCKQHGKYVILKMKDSILFVKLQKGVNLGDKVRIKVTSSSNNCAVGKILQVNPVAQNQKTALVLNSLRDMINHGMHFGEKAVKCHARMKNYIWLKKQGQNKSLTTKRAPRNGTPLIKKGRHVINLLKTRRCLNKALNTLTKYALKGRTFLFIGTKKPATGLVARASFFTKNSFYVNTRWLGGMLTNWKTICKSISKIRPILKEKQKVVRDILERRQNIKSRLIKKALLLRKKSKLILTKGRTLLNAFKNSNTRTEMITRAQKLTALRQECLKKGMNYLQKRQTLIQKRRELIYQTLLLKEKGFQISSKYKAVLAQLAAYTKKLREYKYLLILTAEIQKLKATSEKGTNLYSVSYGKLKEVNKSLSDKAESASWIIPNPPKEILNRIVLTMKQKFETDSLVGAKSSAQKQIIVCSTLLSKFSRFNSYIKASIKTLITHIKSLEVLAQTYGEELNKIKTTLGSYLELKNKYVSELQLLKTKLTNERQVIRIVKRKLKALDAQKKLIKFLPRLRYLPTPQTKISQIVQILLSKVVDPKLKYPIENIYDQKLSTSSKKLAAARKKKWQRLEKYFGGIANMTKLTKTNISRNVAIIIGQKEEMNAVRECQKLGIKTFTIVDTNCNPTLSDHIIPANDDSRNAIKYILTKFITRIRLAQKLRSRLQKLQKTN